MNNEWTYWGRPAEWDEERHGWWVQFQRSRPFVTDELMLDQVLENSGKVHPCHGEKPFGANCTPYVMAFYDRTRRA